MFWPLLQIVIPSSTLQIFGLPVFIETDVNIGGWFASSVVKCQAPLDQ
jgi:hypothetical protein